VVEILDADALKYTITMELVPGLSLEKYVDDNFISTLTEEQCRDVWLGAAQGLQWVHEKGLLYNDIKAENTIYDSKSRRTVLIDFGVATHNIGQYFSGGGTPCYIAPEYLLRQRYPVSDIWALGILIMFAFKLIELPQDTWKLDRVFDTGSPESVKMKAWIARVLANINEAQPRHLELLRRMMSMKPKERIQASELVTCLVSQQWQTLELLT
jgi:serine/threonine protein kinase